jgi:parallel beta-helix repeat protein
VVSGVTLTIDPGVDVKFDGYYSIYVDGTLMAVGTETDRINITSNMTTPALGDWQNIQINSGGRTDIKYCDITYAYECIYISGSSYNNITDSNISYHWNSIDLSGSSYNNISGNYISNNWNGIYLSSSSNNNITNNNISSTEWDGIYLFSSPDNIIAGNYISNNRDGIVLENSSGITVADNDVFSNFNGIVIKYGSKYNTIANNTASNNDDNGIQTLSSNDNTIINNIASNNTYGIHLVGSISNTLVNNQMIGNGIDIDGEVVDEWITHSIDTSNTVNGKPVHYWKNQNGGTIPPGAGQVILANCINVRIEGQDVSDGSAGILLGFSNNNYIANNTASSNTRYIIELSFSDYNTLTNNTASQASGFYLFSSSNNSLSGNKMSYLSTGIVFNTAGIYFTQSSNHNNVIDNVVSPNFQKGIGIKSCIGNTIKDNTFSNNGYGIFFQSSIDNTIKNNKILNNWYGLYIHSSSSNNNIINNDASNNIVGFYLRSSSNRNTIINNNVTLNNNDGIILDSSSDNNITGNNVLLNNWTGILLTSSTNNMIYNNNIVANTNQAYDDSNNGNQWDNGYPSGGNYWSDFDEPSEGAYDDYNGSDQNILGSDGIVDLGVPAGGKNPYIIDADSQDNYPLINLTKKFIFLYPGWNLISIPRIQIETDPGTILSTISGFYRAIQWYNSSDPDDPWKHNCTAKPQHLNDFDGIDHLIGFWIYITEPGGVILDYYGPQPGAPENIPLHIGWNMVGFPSLSGKNRTVGLNNLDFGMEVDAIWAFDGATQTWENVGSGDDFKLGKGYWIHATQECVWEVPL